MTPSNKLNMRELQHQLLLLKKELQQAGAPVSLIRRTEEMELPIKYVKEKKKK